MGWQGAQDPLHCFRVSVLEISFGNQTFPEKNSEFVQSISDYLYILEVWVNYSSPHTYLTTNYLSKKNLGDFNKI